MKKLLIFTLILISQMFCFAQDMDYSVASIPDELLENAKTIVRKDISVFEIENKGKGVLTKEYAITILDESAYEKSVFLESYDKFLKVRNIKATIYDAEGKKVKRITHEDINDRSYNPGTSSFGDNRIKYFYPDYKFYPFTIEYSFEQVFNGLLFYPSWSPYGGYEESVMQSSVTVITDTDFEFKYLLKNNAPEPVISSDNSKKKYHWEMKNLPARENAYFASYDMEVPLVLLAPKVFEIDGYDGLNNSWEDFARWIGQLNQDKNNLSEEAKSEIRGVIKGINDPHKKIQLLYKYMQNRTRYVSIQLGIGGWQPFDANTVERLGYGDCKALTNYMKSILEVANISSNYVLVRAGENARNIRKEFSSNQFNHAFLMVPLVQDTVWLECTSQQYPYNYLGDFTDDRDVLVITEGGGKIVRTPAYSAEENFQHREMKVILDENGNATATGITTYGGANYSDVFRCLLMDKKEIENQLLDEIEISDFTINEFSYKNDTSDIKESLSLSINNLAKKRGERLIIPLNLMNKITWVPKEDEDRTADVLIRRSSSEVDKIIYEYPAGLHVGSMPQPVTIDSKFGKYSISIEEKDGSIEYTREMILYKGMYEPSDYNLLVDFFAKVSKADRMKALLVGGT